MNVFQYLVLKIKTKNVEKVLYRSLFLLGDVQRHIYLLKRKIYETYRKGEKQFVHSCWTNSWIVQPYADNGNVFIQMAFCERSTKQLLTFGLSYALIPRILAIFHPTIVHVLEQYWICHCTLNFSPCIKVNGHRANP